MHIKYYLTYTAVIVYFCGIGSTRLYGQAEYTDLMRDYVMINRDVKKIKDAKIKSAAEIFISGNTQDTLNRAEYDAGGNILKEFSKRDTSSDNSGAYIVKNNHYIYKDNLLVEKIDSSSSQVKKHFIEYDDLSNIVKEDVKVQNTLIAETEYEYDNLSRLIESSTKDILNSCKVIESYSYDSYNNLAKKSTKNECLGTKTKPVNTIYNYKYDSKYRIIEKQATYPNAGYKILTYKYGANGEVVESYESGGSDSYENSVYVYDEKNNSVKIEISEIIGDLTKKSVKVIQNDKFGNKLEEKYFDSNGQLVYTIKINYEYYK
jgi:hypothetical protein